jgi:hypothetical protein
MVDFLFTGVAVLPGTLLLAGHPDLAMMSFFPSLIAACIASVWFGECAAPGQMQRSRSGEQASPSPDERVPARSPERW